MSGRHPSGSTRGSCAEAALSELCIKWGYCIPPVAAQAILADPPADADAFLDAVIVAEGLDPTLMSKTERRPMLEVVNDWLYDERGRGSVSDLPLFPTLG
jgi:hypothetical protein